MLRYHQRLLELERLRRQTGVRLTKGNRDAIADWMDAQHRAAVEAAFRADL